MEGYGLFAWNEPRIYRMEKDGLVSCYAKRVRIECVSGDIWVTWRVGENGRERVLRKGQIMEISPSGGKVCASALIDDSRVRVQSLKFRPFRVPFGAGLGKKLSMARRPAFKN